MLVVVEADASLGGGGGGDTTPGESIVPASAETASAIVSIETAQVRPSLFTFLYLPEECKNFCMNLDHGNFSCKSFRGCVKVAARLKDWEC